jgi:acyl carrier protein
MTNIEQEFANICKDIFDNDDVVITRDTIASDVDGWDSLAHIKLILAVERKFSVRFSAGEVVGIKNVGQLLDLISQKAAK